MFRKISTIIIWSANWRKLAYWYQDIFNFKVIEEINHPYDTGILWELPEGGVHLWVGQHSKIKGKNKDPLRIMFNLDVRSVDEAYKYLLTKKVKVIAKPFKAPTFDKYFATFSDPEGNTFQIIGPA